MTPPHLATASEPRRWPVRKTLDGPFLGYGVGLRRTHFDTIWDHAEAIDFLEILVENFMFFGGKPRHVLERARDLWPLVLHGTSLSIGSVDPLDEDYLEHLFALIKTSKTPWFSDHICFSSAHNVDYHDLIPLPFTEEAVAHVAERVKILQDRANIPFLLENPSYYIRFGDSEMSEAEFINEIVARSGCGLLLDVNNVYVNAQNHGYDARAFIDAMPLDRVLQIHMAGHWDRGDVIIDTHGADVIDPVFELYAYTLERTGPVSTLLERDNHIPDVEKVVAEVQQIRETGEQVLGKVALWQG